jgi:hypothetical protein
MDDDPFGIAVGRHNGIKIGKSELYYGSLISSSNIISSTIPKSKVFY